MNKSDLFFYISMTCLALVALLLEGYSIYYVFTHYGMFKAILVILVELSFDSLVTATMFLE